MADDKKLLYEAMKEGAVHRNRLGYHFLEPAVFALGATGRWVRIGDTAEEAAAYLAKPLPEFILKSVVDDPGAMPAETRAAAQALLSGGGTTYQRLLVLRFLEVEGREGTFCATAPRGWRRA